MNQHFDKHHYFEIAVSSEKVESKNSINIDKSVEHIGKPAEINISCAGNDLKFTGVIYASMLLNFKKHEKVEQLSRKALNIAKNGHQLGDDACKALIVQSYGLLASNKQMQKELAEASKLFCQQAKQSIKLGFKDQALTAWWLAYSAIRKKDKSRYNDIVKKAYEHGLTLDDEVLKASCMRYVAADFYAIVERNGEENKCKSIDDFMTALIGEHWKAEVEQNQKQMKKLSIPKLF